MRLSGKSKLSHNHLREDDQTMSGKKIWITLAVVLCACTVRAEPIRIAYSGVSAAGTPLWLAKEEGLFTKHGLEADLVTVRSAPLQITGLVSYEVLFVPGR